MADVVNRGIVAIHRRLDHRQVLGVSCSLGFGEGDRHERDGHRGHHAQDCDYHDHNEEDIRLSRAGDEHRKVVSRLIVRRIRCHNLFL